MTTLFAPRKIESDAAWLDDNGIKLYAVSAQNRQVERAHYLARLAEVKAARSIDWQATPAFAIFHDGATGAYLILAWWGNDNELFLSVSAQTVQGWIEDPSRHSICIWDLEIIWFERDAFIECLYRTDPDIGRYRAMRLTASGR